MERLTKAAKELPRSLGYPRSPLKALFFNFCKGIAYGFGALVAVAIVVPLLIAFLQKVDWVPMVGRFASDVARQMEQVRGSR